MASGHCHQNHDLYWAIDSEFMMSGRKAHATDVHSIQFSNGLDSSTFIETASQLKQFFWKHNYIKKMYAFNLAPEVGSLRAMLGESYSTHQEANKLGTVKFHKLHNKKICHIKLPNNNCGGFDCKIYDIQPLCHNLGFRNLKSLGKYLGFPKDEPPQWIGIRKWITPEEKETFVKYSLRDAEITSMAARMLKEKWNIDPEIHASVGTVAKEVFNFPVRLEKRENTNQFIIPPLEDRVRRSTFGGRSECFKTGYMEGIFYNDVKSLYPSSMLATRCLQITGAKECELSELDITGKVADAYGWIEGYFETNNELWGLPRRAKNNIYMTGTFPGFYNTFDLAAAKAKIIHAEVCFKPTFNPDATYHEKLSKMYFDKLSGKLSKEEAIFAKAVMNSASGKLGQGTSYWKGASSESGSFPAATSNYFAYNTLLSHSHFTMSRLYDLCKSLPVYTDTDSIMIDYDMSGTTFYYSDGVRDIPITLDVKSFGDLSLFRSKRYILDISKDADGYTKDGFASPGWKYNRESFLVFRYGDISHIDTHFKSKVPLILGQKRLQRWNCADGSINQSL
jgi:DNA polymerase family B